MPCCSLREFQIIAFLLLLGSLLGNAQELETFIEEALVKAGIKQSIDDRDRNRNARGGQAGFHGGQVPYWDFLFKDLGE